MVNGISLQIGNYKFNRVINCKINKTTRLLSNTATIELPLSAVFENKKMLTIRNLIKRGDKVSISFGYNETMREEFKGYVLSVSDKNNTIIECEDDMFLLRKPIANKLFKKSTLKDVIDYILKDFPVKLNKDIPVVEFDSFLLKDISAIGAIQKIKDDYGLLAFIDENNKLYVGLSYTYSSGEVYYDLQKEVQEVNLEYKESTDLKYKIKAVSFLKNNKKIEIETGDDDGELRTLHFYNISDKAEIAKLAKQEIEKYKYAGYRGSISTWGVPYSSFGMSATIKDGNYPEREGNYYIESVTTYWGDGFKREIELGVKL